MDEHFNENKEHEPLMPGAEENSTAARDRGSSPENGDSENPNEPTFDAQKYWRELNGTDNGDSHTDQEEYWTSFRDHGSGHPGEPGYGEIPEEYRVSGLTRAALIFGIVSLVAVFFGMSVPFAAIAITLALLSKRKKFSRQAKTAIGLASAGILAFAISMGLSLWLLISTGVWDVMMDGIRNMDPNDPYAISTLQEEILSELQNRLYGGLGIGDSSAETTVGAAEGDANAAADSTSDAGSSIAGADSAADAGNPAAKSEAPSAAL